MKDNEVYESWKQEKRQIDVSHHFSDQVMNKVYNLEQSRNITQSRMERFIEQISFNPLAKFVLVAAGAVTGIVRLIIMINSILSNGVING